MCGVAVSIISNDNDGDDDDDDDDNDDNDDDDNEDNKDNDDVIVIPNDAFVFFSTVVNSGHSNNDAWFGS